MRHRHSLAEFCQWYEAFGEQQLEEGAYKGALPAGVPLLQEPAPCDACLFRERCGSRLLACERFMLFVAGRSWTNATAIPTRGQWKALFEESGVLEKSSSGLRAI